MPPVSPEFINAVKGVVAPPPPELPKVGSLYRHYKGKNYRVIALGTHNTETGESLVVYRDAEDKTAPPWVRPLYGPNGWLTSIRYYAEGQLLNEDPSRMARFTLQEEKTHGS